MLTLKPRLSRRQPIEEAATPLPSEETTPPVTNIYFGAIRIARAVTRFTAPDFSYLSGRPTIARRGVRGRCTCNPEYETRQRTNNYGRDSARCQFQLFAALHAKFFYPRNLFAVPGFDSAELRRPAPCPSVPRLAVRVSEVRESVQLLLPTQAVLRGNPWRAVAI